MIAGVLAQVGAEQEAVSGSQSARDVSQQAASAGRIEVADGASEECHDGRCRKIRPEIERIGDVADDRLDA